MVLARRRSQFLTLWERLSLNWISASSVWWWWCSGVAKTCTQAILQSTTLCRFAKKKNRIGCVWVRPCYKYVLNVEFLFVEMSFSWRSLIKTKHLILFFTKTTGKMSHLTEKKKKNPQNKQYQSGFQLTVVSHSELLWLCFTTCYDWFKITRHLLNQLDVKPKLITRVFLRLAPVTCTWSDYSLVHFVSFLWFAI